jgi:hypothetical protein
MYYIGLHSEKFYFQGVFIFLAFTLTKKVRDGYKKQVSEEAYSSSSCWSRTRSKTTSTYITDVKRTAGSKR